MHHDLMENQNESKGNWIMVFCGVLAVAFIILVTYTYYAHNKPFWETEKIVRETANEMLKTKMEFGSHNLPSKTDAWGNTLLYIKRINKERDKITHKVQSIGPDRMENTGDDIYHVIEDHNISKKVGKWIGEVSKETFKGIAEGVTGKSEFDDEEKPSVSERVGKTGRGILDGLKKGWNSGSEDKEN